MTNLTQTICNLQHRVILDLHVGHVCGKVQKNILSILLWASAVVGELHCLVTPERLVASQEYNLVIADEAKFNMVCKFATN